MCKPEGELTVAVVTGVDASLQSLHLCELGQHLRERAAAVEGGGGGAFVCTVVALREFQGQIPERLHRVGLVLTGQTSHLEEQRKQSEKGSDPLHVLETAFS